MKEKTCTQGMLSASSTSTPTSSTAAPVLPSVSLEDYSFFVVSSTPYSGDSAFLGVDSIFGVCDLTFPAFARDPWVGILISSRL